MSRKKLTTNDFIKRAKKIHGNKYNYSISEYKLYNTDVKIICSQYKHGIFKQKAANHLKGHGCPKCGNERRNKKQSLTMDEFIKRVKKIHGSRYDYSEVKYKNYYSKVKIICKEHGKWYQKPSAHLIGKGCPKCVGKNRTQEEFIKEINKVHGNKYDYSKTVYKNTKKKITIICSKEGHGEFKQRASHHLDG